VIAAEVFTATGRDRLAAGAMARPVLFLMIVYAVSRLCALAAMAFAAQWFQTPAGVGHLYPEMGDVFSLWDSVWYHRVAVDGYPIPVPADPDTGKLTYSAWAFYPVFPLVVRALMSLGLPFLPAAIGLNVVFGALGTLLVWRVFRYASHAAPQPARERLALMAAALWCFYPATGILLMPYTEAIAVTLIAGALLLLMRRRYAEAAAVVLVLGFTRAVAPAIGCAVAAHLWVRWREDRAAGTTPLNGQRGAAGLLAGATAASAVSWPAYVGIATGLPTAFFEVQAAWGQRPDKGPFVLWMQWAWERHGLFSVAVMLSLVGTYLALVVGRHGRWLPLEVRVFALAYPLYLFAVVRPITSMWRFLLLDFPIAALLASVAMRTSSGARVVRHWRRRVAVLILPLVAGMFWWTATLLTYTPWGATPP
jgi:hypothetical protein